MSNATDPQRSQAPIRPAVFDMKGGEKAHLATITLLAINKTIAKRKSAERPIWTLCEFAPASSATYLGYLGRGLISVQPYPD